MNIYLPGFSSTLQLNKHSRPSPILLRSATNFNLSKFIFAPEVMATKIPPEISFPRSPKNFFTPATPYNIIN